VPKLVSANFSRILRMSAGGTATGRRWEVAAIPTLTNSFVEATAQNRQSDGAGAHGGAGPAVHAGARADRTVSA